MYRYTRLRTVSLLAPLPLRFGLQLFASASISLQLQFLQNVVSGKKGAVLLAEDIC
jgi:hypothetical protein